MNELMQALATGGDVALFGMLYFLHRLDRRIYALEIKVQDED